MREWGRRTAAAAVTDAITATLAESKRAGRLHEAAVATVVAMQRGNGHNPVTNSICRNKRTPTSTCRRRAYLPPLSLIQFPSPFELVPALLSVIRMPRRAAPRCVGVLGLLRCQTSPTFCVTSTDTVYQTRDRARRLIRFIAAEICLSITDVRMEVRMIYFNRSH